MVVRSKLEVNKGSNKRSECKQFRATKHKQKVLYSKKSEQKRVIVCSSNKYLFVVSSRFERTFNIYTKSKSSLCV